MADMTGAERVVADAWITETLASVDDLNTISAGLSARVYADQAPASAKYPFIVFQAQDEPSDVRGVGSSSVMTEALYLIKVVAKAGYVNIAPILVAVNTALNKPQGGSPAVGGTVLSSVKERNFSLKEPDEDQTIVNLGAFYRMQIVGNV